jgi:hypothetical protein
MLYDERVTQYTCLVRRGLELHTEHILYSFVLASIHQQHIYIIRFLVLFAWLLLEDYMMQKVVVLWLGNHTV